MAYEVTTLVPDSYNADISAHRLYGNPAIWSLAVPSAVAALFVFAGLMSFVQAL